MAVYADYFNPTLGRVERVRLEPDTRGFYVLMRKDLPSRERRLRKNQVYERCLARVEAHVRTGRYNGRCVRPGERHANEFTALKVA